VRSALVSVVTNPLLRHGDANPLLGGSAPPQLGWGAVGRLADQLSMGAEASAGPGSHHASAILRRCRSNSSSDTRPRSTRSVISVSCARGSTMRAVPQISTLFNPYGLNRSRRRLRDLPVCLDITAPEDATGSQPRSGECLLLEGFELGLRDGARVEKSFRRPDFAGRVAASRDCSDVLICGCRAAFPWSTIRPCRGTLR
jgi:hypothetical protein